MAGWKHLNEIIHAEAARENKMISDALALFGAEVAQFQLRGSRHFFDEHPQNYDKFKMPSWIELLQHPKVEQVVFHQCQFGKRCEKSGLPGKKASTATASDTVLLEPFRNELCVGKFKCARHQHVAGNVNSQIWPWAMAQKLADAVAKLIMSAGKIN